MNRRTRVMASTALAAAAVFGLNASAYAATTFDTGMVTVTGGTRAIGVDVGGLAVVSLAKVSNPGVQVRVTVDEGSAPAMTVHAAGENGCSAADNPAAGTLNRTVNLQGGPSANVYVKVEYTTTTVLGLSNLTVLEPLGHNGLTVGGLGLVLGMPVSVCVA